MFEDDLTGGPAEHTIRFAFDRNAKNAATFSKQLAPYLGHARRPGRAQPRRPGGQRSAASARQHSLALMETMGDIVVPTGRW